MSLLPIACRARPIPCMLLFLMSSVCVFRESLDHLVTRGGKDLLDHLETR